MEEWNWQAIRSYYGACRSVCKTCQHFNLPARAWRMAAAKGLPPEHQPPQLTPSEKRVAIDALLRDGHSQAVIGVELGLSKATVSYHAHRLGRPVHDEFARRYDWNQIQRAHDSGMRALECCEHFGFSKATWCKAVAAGRLQPRSHLIPLDQL